MHIFDLPIEVFKELFEFVVLDLGVNRSMKARLVCKAFDAELVDALFSTKTIIEPLPPSPYFTGYGKVQLERARDGEGLKWTSRLLRESVLNRSIRREPVFIIEKTLDALMDENSDRSEESRLNYLSQICMMIAMHNDPFVEQLVPNLPPEREKCHVEVTDISKIERHILSAAAWVGNLEHVKAWITQRCTKVKNINPENKYMPAPLSCAARQGHIEIVELFLEAGVKDYKRNSNRLDTAISAASRSGHEKVVHLLLDPKYGFDTSSPEMEEALLEAASGGKASVLKLLLGKITVPDRNPVLQGRHRRQGGEWPSLLERLLWNACRHGSIEAVKMLLDMGTNPDIGIDSKNRSCIQVAAKAGYAEIVQMLLPSRSTTSIPSSIVLAAKGGFVHTMEVLLDAGKESYNYYWSSLSEAAARGHSDAVRLLLTRGLDTEDVFCYDDIPLAELALKAACHGDYSSVVRVLAEYGCDVRGAFKVKKSINKCSLISLTSRRSALLKGREDVVKTLIELGVEKKAAMGILDL